MRVPLRHAPLLLGATLLAAGLAFAATAPRGASAPIRNFRLPGFTNDGFRTWLLRGSQAHYVGNHQVEVKEMTLAIFSGDASDRLVTMILSPVATVHTADLVACGGDTIRVIHYTEDFQITGRDWRYEHKQKRVSIAKDVNVTYHAEVKDLLK